MPGGPPEEEASGLARAASSLFWGPDGLRAAWRLPIALTAWFIVLSAAQVLVLLLPGLHDWLHAQVLSGLASPGTMFVIEVPYVLATLSAMAVMAKIEGRSFRDYYLPRSEAFGKRFWQGLPFGFAMLSVLMGVIAAGNGFSVGKPELTVATAVKFGLLYLMGFLLVAVFEETSFRGYLQATLQQAMGFWPAAIVLAAMFGAIHLGNSSEAKYGAFMAGCFGIFAAFTLQRTGNLWFVIGVHTAWDWGETFFYSAPDSGILASGHLMSSSLHGPLWLTGGSSGPEASVFSAPVLFLGAVAIHFLFPAKAPMPEI
jgi:uncharacterized protein